MELRELIRESILHQINSIEESVDKSITNMLFYHGTNTKFDKFDKKFIGSQTDEGLYGRGFYFATAPNIAMNTIRGKAKYVITAKLKLQNPLHISEYTASELAEHLNMDENDFIENRGICKPNMSSIPMFTRAVKGAGHDGVYVSRGGLSDEVVVFSPEDIEIVETIEESVDNETLRRMKDFGLFRNDIDSEGYVTLYHGGKQLPKKLNKDEIFFMTPWIAEAEDYAAMRKGKVFTLKVKPEDCAWNIGSREVEYDKGGKIVNGAIISPEKKKVNRVSTKEQWIDDIRKTCKSFKNVLLKVK